MLPDLFDLPRPARGRAASPWTEERLRHLRPGWKAGARAREIGAQVGVSALLGRRGGGSDQARPRGAVDAGVPGAGTAAAARAGRRVRQADNARREAAWSR